MTTVPERSALDMRAPSGEGVSAPYAAQQLAGTGATGVENATALATGRYATLINDTDVPVRYRMGSSAGAVEADTTDPVLGPYGRIDWFVTTLVDDKVSVQAKDGSSAFEAHVWSSNR